MYKLGSLTLEITNRCNANCIHCIIGAGEEKKNTLSCAEIIKLIEDAADLGCKRIIFTGGEPFLRKEWPLFLQKARSLSMTISFMSNGVLIDDYIIKTFSDFGATSLGISLDGPDAETHDRIRGQKGVFDNFVKIIPKILDAEIYVAVPTTVMNSNFDKLDEIRDLLIDLKVPVWQLQIVKKSPKLPDSELLSEAQYYKLAEKIVEYRKNYSDKISVYEADCIGYNSKLSEGLYWNQWRGCECGLYSAAVTSDGDVKGCSNMDFSEGNIKKREFKEIWNDHNSFKYNRSPNVDNLKGFCNNCNNKFVCRGGCPINPSSPKGSTYCLHKIETCGCDTLEK